MTKKIESPNISSNLNAQVAKTAPKGAETALAGEEMPKKRRLRNKINRIPFHKQKRIGIKPREGYHRRLVNDDGDRIQAFLDAGYTHVEGVAKDGDKDSADSSQMGKKASQAVGNGMTAYYMEIPLEYFDEDQADKQNSLDQRDKLIGLDKIPKELRRGKIKENYGPIEDQ